MLSLLQKCARVGALLVALNVALMISVPVVAQQPSPGFRWPDGKSFALSLSFDDARESQVDNVLPVLDRHGVKATFFLVPSLAEKRLDGWKRAVVAGHEIGNHSMHHPCSLNYRFPAARRTAWDQSVDQGQAECYGQPVCLSLRTNVCRTWP